MKPAPVRIRVGRQAGSNGAKVVRVNRNATVRVGASATVVSGCRCGARVIS